MLFFIGMGGLRWVAHLFLMSGDGDGGDGGGDRFGVGGWCVRDNLADFYLFRSISVVCSFFCIKKSHEKAVNY